MFRSAPTTACAQYKPAKLALRGATEVLAAMVSNHPPILPGNSNKLITDFVAAAKADRLEHEDWPESSRKTFDALQAYACSLSTNS